MATSSYPDSGIKPIPPNSQDGNINPDDPNPPDSDINPDDPSPPDSDINPDDPNPPDSDNNPAAPNPPINDQTPKKISILVTGITGSGKSALVNSILGLNDDDKGAKEGDQASAAQTTKVTKYKGVRDNTDIKVWDSPGLRDGMEREVQQAYLKKIKKKSPSRNVTIHCVQVSDARFVHGEDNSQVEVMNMLTKEFTPEFWRNTIIALTFADGIWVNQRITRLPQQRRLAAFIENIKQFKSSIQDILEHDVEVPREIVDTIKFAHTGHYLDPNNVNTDSWLQDLWSQHLATRTVDATQKIKRMKKRGRLVGGFLGILGGPLMPLTIPLGVVIGRKYGKKRATKTKSIHTKVT